MLGGWHTVAQTHAAEPEQTPITDPGTSLWNEALRYATTGDMAGAKIHWRILAEAHPEHPLADRARLRLAQADQHAVPVVRAACQFVPFAMTESRKVDLLATTRPVSMSRDAIGQWIGSMLPKWVANPIDSCEKSRPELGEETSEPPLAKPKPNGEATPEAKPVSLIKPTSIESTADDDNEATKTVKIGLGAWLHTKFQVEVQIKPNQVRVMIYGHEYERPRK